MWTSPLSLSCIPLNISLVLNYFQAGYSPIMMAALAGVTKDDKEIARKMFRSGDVNKQVEDVSKLAVVPKKCSLILFYVADFS